MKFSFRFDLILFRFALFRLRLQNVNQTKTGAIKRVIPNLFVWNKPWIGHRIKCAI